MLAEEIKLIFNSDTANYQMRLLQLVISMIFLIMISFAFADEYPMPAPGNDIVGRNFIIKVASGDTVTTIRQRYNISYHELLEANPQENFYHLRVGDQLLIPKEFILPKYRRGIVVNIPELRLYYFTPDGRYVYTFPIGLGRSDWRTPILSAKVVRKEADPVWHVPTSIREYVLDKTGELLPEFVEPGPKNPLGKYALYLSKEGYLIHGTNQPESVGTFASSGCMRLLSEPIQTLYQDVEIGTPVYVIHHPNKVGWLGDKLYLESHLPVKSYDTISNNTPIELTQMSAEVAINYATNFRPAVINWELVLQTVKQHSGIPQVIGSKYEVFN